MRLSPFFFVSLFCNSVTFTLQASDLQTLRVVIRAHVIVYSVCALVPNVDTNALLHYYIQMIGDATAHATAPLPKDHITGPSAASIDVSTWSA